MDRLSAGCVLLRNCRHSPSDSANGRMQTIQAGNQIAGETVNQLMMADMQQKSTVEAVTTEMKKKFFSGANFETASAEKRDLYE
jgi:conjugal transfer/entry exclusion protein